jgi:hypothetical protein
VTASPKKKKSKKKTNGKLEGGATAVETNGVKHDQADVDDEEEEEDGILSPVVRDEHDNAFGSGR